MRQGVAVAAVPVWALRPPRRLGVRARDAPRREVEQKLLVGAAFQRLALGERAVRVLDDVLEAELVENVAHPVHVQRMRRARAEAAGAGGRERNVMPMNPFSGTYSGWRDPSASATAKPAAKNRNDRLLVANADRGGMPTSVRKVPQTAVSRPFGVFITDGVGPSLFSEVIHGERSSGCGNGGRLLV